MSLQVRENPVRIPQEAQETSWQNFCVTMQQVAETVYNYATQILKLFYLLGYMVYRSCWEGREIDLEQLPREQGANFSRAFRRMLQDPIAEVIPVQGADPRLNLNHLRAPMGEDLVVPDAPEIDTAVLNALFEEKINVIDRQSPYYIEVSTITDDPDAPATYLQLKDGLQKFLVFIMDERPNYSPELPKMLKHITYELQNGLHPLDTERECLLSIARAGQRHCPTLMNGVTQVWYRILKVQVREKPFHETILSILHDFRQSTLYKMSGQDVHYYQEYLASIGTHLGIKLADAAENDDPYLMIQLAPRYSLPAFFREYTPEAVVSEVARALNGRAKPAGHPWERVGRKILFEETCEWLRANLPAGREVDEYLDQETNTLNREGILFILQRLQIFMPQQVD